MASALTAARFALSEMGVVRGARTLLQVNQPDGIDCPGCAWPEPDSGRSHFEFCEEGAKHVADEATTKRVTPEFFAKWSVKELADQSDLWLNQQGRLTHPMICAKARSITRLLIGRTLRAHRERAECAGFAGRSDLLYVRPHQQRSGVSVSALRAPVRHKQSARLLEHVS